MNDPAVQDNVSTQQPVSGVLRTSDVTACHHPAKCLDTNLHSGGSDHIEGRDHSGDKVHDFGEALLADTPGAVDEKHHVGFGASAN